MELRMHLCSSLAKIFPLKGPDQPSFRSASALKGERFSFQLAFIAVENRALKAEVLSPLKKRISLKRVELMPVRYTSWYRAEGDDVISSDPGLYPDALLPVDGTFRFAPGQWNSLWVTVDVPAGCKPGKYPVSVRLSNPDNPEESVESPVFTLEVLNAALPHQTLIHTEWFHADCLATYYKVPVWSEEHWRIVENFVRSAAAHGINMLLTPVFTPPLDTRVGGERPTTQLVGVTLENGGYSFDFSRLERWIDMVRKAGIEYLEISHLFTQWGAAFCPKIVATVDGKEKRIFGWDVKSDSRKYRSFLDSFLPALTSFLTEHGWKDKTFFHCSDEPAPAHLETYGKAVSIMRKHLKDFKICDALSNVDYYQKGLVSIPIPGEDHIEPFLQAGIEKPWTYYCCGQLEKVSNRFLHMPSSRNRIMGTLLYRYDCTGFLQWGFNFYHTVHSVASVDPWSVLEADYAFPPGDAFMVYPGVDGQPVDSIHYETFTEGLQDLRALRLLEGKVPREKLCAMLDKLSPGGRMSMKEYPRGEAAVLALRKKINSLIKKHFA